MMLATLDPAVVLGALALVLALVTVGTARWRDLGVLPLCLLGGAIAAIGDHGAIVALLGVGVVLAVAVGWWRGAAAGVARPELAGLGVLVLAAGGLARAFLVPLAVGGPVPLVAGPLAIPAVVIGILGAALALERPGPRRTRPRWHRVVPVTARAPRPPMDSTAPPS